MSDINNKLLELYIARGATSKSLPMAEMEALIAAGAADGKWSTFLAGEGYTGSLQDMMYKYLGDLGYTSPSISDRWLAAVLDDALLAAGFDPASFVENGSAGWWFVGSDMTSKWVDSTGLTAVASDADPIGKWSPALGSGYLSQGDSSLKPYWDSATASVVFPNKAGGGNPYNLGSQTGDFNIPHTTPVTLMMTTWAPTANAGGGGVARQTVQLYSTPDYGEVGRRVGLTPHAFSNRSVATFGGNEETLTSTELAATQSTLSVTRTAAGKLVNFYINGVLQDAGPSASNVYASPLEWMYIYSSQGDGGGAFYVKDIIIATKEATTDDHINYAAYGATL